MSLQEIEKAIVSLPAPEVDALAAWLDELRARRWDEKIEADVESGRLDALLDEVEAEHRAGLSKPL